MKPSDLRTLLNAEWSRIEHEAEEKKDSQSAVFRLAQLYHSLSEAERNEADEVLIEWALSDDPKKRFDGLALIDRFSIFSAVTALSRLANRFKLEDEPSSPYDLAKVNRILERLTSATPRNREDE